MYKFLTRRSLTLSVPTILFLTFPRLDEGPEDPFGYSTDT